MKPIARLQWAPPFEGDCGRAAVEVLDKKAFPAGFAALVRVAPVSIHTSAGSDDPVWTYGCRLDVGDAMPVMDEDPDQCGPVNNECQAVVAGLNMMARQCEKMLSSAPVASYKARVSRMGSALRTIANLVAAKGLGAVIEIYEANLNYHERNAAAMDTPGGTPSVPQLTAEQLAEARAFDDESNAASAAATEARCVASMVADGSTPEEAKAFVGLAARPDETDEPSRSAEEYPEGHPMDLAKKSDAIRAAANGPEVAALRELRGAETAQPVTVKRPRGRPRKVQPAAPSPQLTKALDVPATVPVQPAVGGTSGPVEPPSAPASGPVDAAIAEKAARFDRAAAAHARIAELRQQLDAKSGQLTAIRNQALELEWAIDAIRRNITDATAELDTLLTGKAVEP